MKKRDYTIRVAKTKALISFAVTAKLICVFVFAYAKSRFSHNEAYLAYLWVPTFEFNVTFKTAITLTPPTVGRQSADKMPDFSSFFIGRQKINYNYLVIIFFHRPTVLGFWQSADGRPTIGR